jgi:hypothetical protein
LFVEEGGEVENFGEESEMTLKNATWETLLNWLVRSKKTAMGEGTKLFVDWGREIYFST